MDAKDLCIKSGWEGYRVDMVCPAVGCGCKNEDVLFFSVFDGFSDLIMWTVKSQ
jgi:hypothetical protein